MARSASGSSKRATEGPTLAREVIDAANRIIKRAGGVSALDARARRAYLGALQLEYETAVQGNDTEKTLAIAEARAAAARGFDQESFLEASVAACLALRWAGQLGEAVRRLRSVWAEAQRHVFPRLAVDAGFWLADAHRITGELEEAERIASETNELATRAGDVPRARHRIAKVVCDVALERGQPWAALERFEHETAAEPNEHQRIIWHADLARWIARLNGADAAAVVHEQLAAGRECADWVGCGRCGADLLLRSAEALARIGDRKRAREMLAASDLGPRKDELNILVRSHSGALAVEDPAGRAERLETVLAAAKESPFRLQTIWARFDLGRALVDAGDNRAAEELEHVVAVAEGLGARTVEQIAGRALRSLGVRTWRRAAAGAPLTEREQEVARLVAEGSTNREIAQMLFISPKTVERHVSNVFKKVGVRNRAELASRLSGRIAADV